MACPFSQHSGEIHEQSAALTSPKSLTAAHPDSAHLLAITTWVKQFLATPNPNLGRTGPVCPFVPEALSRDTLKLVVVHLPDGDRTAAIEQTVLNYKQVFTEMEPTGKDGRIFKTLLMIFPEVTTEDAPELIDEVQRRLKAGFVDQGLMLGEFHEKNMCPGLHNDNFFPLRSPIPMLVIRHMVSSDILFLNRPEFDLETRMRYIRSYLYHQPALSRRDRALAEAALEQAVRDSESFADAPQLLVHAAPAS
jgi:hypothetical protein